MRRLKRRLLWQLLPVAIVLTGCIVHAQPPNLKQNPTFLLYNAMPYGFIDGNGNPAGIVADMAKLIAAEAGLKFDIYVVPSARIVSELAKGNADLVILTDGLAANSVAEKIATVSKVNTLLIKLDGAPQNRASTDQIVGYIRGGAYENALWEYVDHLKLKRTTFISTQTGIELLIRGRIDYLVSIEKTLAYNLLVYDIKDKIKLIQRFEDSDSNLYIAKNSTHKRSLKPYLKQVVETLNKTKRIQQIHQHLKL